MTQMIIHSFKNVKHQKLIGTNINNLMIIKLMNCNQKSKIIPITIVWKMINYNIKSKNKKCL